MLRSYLKEIKWWKQRRTRGFDDVQLWNLDTTIAEFILPRLKAFREMDRSGLCPSNFMSEEDNELFMSYSENEKKCKALEAKYSKKWNETLDSMIEYFDIYLNRQDDLYDIVDEKGKSTKDVPFEDMFEWIPLEDDMTEMRPKFKTKIKHNKKLINRYEKGKANFWKFFDGLWD